KYTDKFEIIATLLYGLVKDHPFHDANKRTAFLSTLYFLQKLGYMPAISHEEFEDFLVEVAGDEIKLKKRYKEFVKKYEDPEVQYVAWYLRKNTRRIDRRQYIITYRQLQKILNRYNFDLKNPAGNQIGVYQYKRAKLSLIRDK